MWYLNLWGRLFNKGTDLNNGFWSWLGNALLLAIWLMVHGAIAFGLYWLASNATSVDWAGLWSTDWIRLSVSSLLTLTVAYIVLRLTGIRQRGRAGFYFNYISWNLFLPVFGLLYGGAIALFIRGILDAFVLLGWLSGHPISSIFVAILTIALAVVGWLVPEKREEGEEHILDVPGTRKSALATWNGIPLPFYLMTSKYSKLGKGYGLDVDLAQVKSFTTASGFIEQGPITFRVWNDSTAEKDTRERSRITAPAKNNASVEGALTLVLEAINPRKMRNATDPALDIGDRARQEFRELTQLIVDTQIPKLHSALTPLFTGTPLVTCFLGETVDGREVGSIVVDQSGQVMFELAEDGDIAAASERLTRRMFRNANRNMLVKVTETDDAGTSSIRLSVIRVTNPISEVLKDNGYKLKRANFADIEFSDPVKQAYNEASAEGAQRVTQLASADTLVEYRRKILPDPSEAENPGFELTTILGAATDPGNKTGNVRVFWNNPGGNPITSGFVAGAAATGD